MRRHCFHLTLFVIVIVAIALTVWVAVYSPIEFRLTRATLAAVVGILAASATAAFFLWARTIRATQSIALRRRKNAGARILADRATFVEYADLALTGSNQTGRSILLVEIDCAASSAELSTGVGHDAILLEAGDTVFGIADRSGGSITAKIGHDLFAILIRGRMSDQVLATAEQILAATIAMRDSQPISAHIGICFCLPGTKTEAALRISQDALRLAKRSGGSAWRSIAEGGTRAVTRRSLRAPALTRSSSGAATS